MFVQYKKNKQRVCYDSEILVTGNRPLPEKRLCGPFVSCGNCPYASHGFLCYSREGDCLKTHMNKINQKKKGEKTCSN